MGEGMSFTFPQPCKKVVTELLYLHDQESMKATATIVDSYHRGSNYVVVADRTPMYPKRGGQPSDTGVITGDGFTVAVRSVVLNGEGHAEHIGDLSGRAPHRDERVAITVDGDVRRLHSLWHSAGEAVIVAAKMAGFDEPVCGAIHYGPNQNRIEYKKKLDVSEANQLRSDIETNLIRLVSDDTPIMSIDLTGKQEVIQHCGFWPDYLMVGQNVRVIHIRPDYTGRPCSGTHLSRTSELGRIEVNNVKVKSGKTIVSYSCIAS
jgi:alanyl-tRNA synthetase